VSFAVTGLGRCGTMALARFLNTAPGWTVKHQNDSENHRLGYRLVKHWRRFSRPNYGEVSCALLPVLGGLPCKHKAVILRDLKQTALSAANYSIKVGMGAKVPLIDELPYTLEMLDAWLQAGATPIYYDRLFSSKESVEHVARELGIEGPLTFDIHERHNMGAKKFNSFGELTPEHQRTVESCAWFEEMWL